MVVQRSRSVRQDYGSDSLRLDSSSRVGPESDGQGHVSFWLLLGLPPNAHVGSQGGV